MRCGLALSSVADADTFFSSPGDTVYIQRTGVIVDGRLDTQEVGRYDIQTMIESYRDTTDMAYILARLNAGDDSVLHMRNSMYGDFSGFTNDKREALQNVMDARTYFDHLDDETREKFGNDFLKWIGSAGSPDWIRNMTKNPQVSPAEPVIEKKEENKE